MEGKQAYLWVNMCDLDGMGTIGGFGSPLMLMVNRSLGDNLLPGAYMQDGARAMLDQVYVVIETTPQRAEALQGALGVISKRKINRPCRCRTTANLPGKGWRWTSG